ncbi:MAG: hypothetical protein GY716_16845 [bacterium]|nr:hypothetical protein [bacterium]
MSDNRSNEQCELLELTPREQKILRMRFGFPDAPGPADREEDLQPASAPPWTRGGGRGGSGGTPPAAFVAVVRSDNSDTRKKPD